MNKNTKIFHLAKMTEGQKKSVFEEIKNGALAVVPTDTVYGLVGAAYAFQTMHRINELKQNPAGKPMQILCTPEQANDLVQPSDNLTSLSNKFWPGNLTVIAKATKAGAMLQDGQNTVGLRVPNFRFVLDLMEDISSPLFATSANLHGQDVVQNELSVISAFDGLVDIIVLHGDILTASSTVVDITSDGLKIIRQGDIPEESLNNAI